MAKRKKQKSLVAKFMVMGMGAGLIALTIALIVACASYNPYDSGYNISNSREITNWLGAFGAYQASWILGWFGLALPIFLVAPIVWGYEVIRYKVFMHLWGRVIAFVLGFTFFSICLNLCCGRMGSFDVGGDIGIFFSRNILTLMNKMVAFSYNKYLLIAITFVLSFISFNYACGITFASWNKVIKAILGTVMAVVLFFGKQIAKVWKALGSSKKNKKTQRPQRPKKEPKITEPKIKKETKAATETIKIAKPVRRIADDGYELPDIELLSVGKDKSTQHMSQKELDRTAAKLEEVLQEFGVIGKIVQIRPGPVVTLYELEPAPGTKMARVIGLSDDIARSMSAVSVRIAVVPGSNTIGIEMPNTSREIVYLRDLLESEEFRTSKANLTISLGKDIGGKNTYADLAKMPHLLVAGTTGSGKSVGVNSMIISLLYKMRPEECKLIMIDPKMLEFTMYNGIPHLLTPVITDPAKAVIGLKWAVKEMEDRYRAMAQLNVRNITGYNQRLEELRESGEKVVRKVQTGFEPDTGRPIYEEQELDLTPMPYIVIVVDEMADLMLVAGKDVEAAIQRLAQMARAAGIHLIMSTQRPSVDVITGTIKANFPTRISYQVTSKIDSRTILGEQGAEQLLGMGDMLYMPAGQRPRRVHAPFVKDSEVEKIVEFLKTQRQPEYVEAVTEGELSDSKSSGGGAVFDNTSMGGGSSDDDLYNQAVEIVRTDKKASISYIQRRLRIGYNRAASIIERMEDEGVVSKTDHVGRREVL
ncbi:MAG: cell division protein FtsK [Alphaproteobacteria bacterium]|nr:cell division protein FtsK [Alphaproteobacteria bacterium]MBE6467417.1 cell division protein FtsK [Alphaproteobacteria bacterium]